MNEQPHLKEVPTPEPEANIVRATEAVNDAVYNPGKETTVSLSELSTTELFARRKAHGIIARQGWRDTEFDLQMIDKIKAEMVIRGVTEAAYQAFLESYTKEE